MTQLNNSFAETWLPEGVMASYHQALRGVAKINAITPKVEGML
jgi:hypothetical protein